MKYRVIVPSLLLLLSTTCVVQAEATSEEADRIKSSFEAYIGKEQGVVEVEPDGDDYIITLDVMPYITKNATPDYSAKIDPLVLRVTPEDGDTWTVVSSGPYAFSFADSKTINSDARIEKYDWKGTFDEALGGFSTSSFEASNFVVSQTITDPTLGVKVKTDYTIANISRTSTATATSAGDGISDAEATVNFSGLVLASKSELTPEMAASGFPAIDYTASLSKGSYTTSMSSANLLAMLDIMSWFVAHPKQELVEEDQAELKEKILKGLPFFNNLSGTGNLENLKVVTSLGNFAAELGSTSVNLNGIVKEGSFGEGISLSGITIPAGLAPAWATSLVPNSFKLDFSVSGFDVEAPARLIVAAMDLTKEPVIPTELEAQLLPALSPSNSVVISLAPGEIVSPAYTLSYEGALTANFAGLPTGKATIRLRGMDAIMTSLQGAGDDPSAKQGLGALIAAKGFGKAEADGSLVWEIVGTPTGQVTINGLDMSSMIGTPPVAPAQ